MKTKSCANRLVIPVITLVVCATGPGLKAQSLEGINENGFPLTVGNRWEYRVGTELNVLSPALAWPSEAILEILATEEALGQQAFHFRTTHRFLLGPDSEKIVTGDTWFSMQEDTLWGIATDVVGGLNPVSAQLLKPVA